jgi:hypothetical protein
MSSTQNFLWASGGLKIWIDFLDDTRVKFAPTPRPALLQAAKTIRQYRKNGGNKTGVLTDFFVGAHAVVENLPLLTRAPRRLSYLFPNADVDHS